MNINDENIIEITDELSSEYEISKVLRKYPKDTVIIKNVKGFDMPVISGICNTREKIANSINCEVSEITQKIIDAMEKPLKVDKFTDFSEYETSDVDLNKIPILTHYKRDGGAYITAGVVFADQRCGPAGGAGGNPFARAFPPHSHPEDHDRCGLPGLYPYGEVLLRRRGPHLEPAEPEAHHSREGPDLRGPAERERRRSRQRDPGRKVRLRKSHEISLDRVLRDPVLLRKNAV